MKLYANENYQDAVIFFNGSSEVYPDSKYGFYIHDQSARALQKPGRREEAIGEARESLRLNGEFESAQVLLEKLTG